MKYKFFLLYIIILLAFDQNLNAQRQDSIHAKLLFNTADSLKKIQLYKVAIPIFKNAAEIFASKHEWTDFMKCQNKIIQCNKGLRNYDSGILIGKKNIQISEDLNEIDIRQVIELNNNTASCYLIKKSYDSALSYYTSAFNIINDSNASLDSLKAFTSFYLGLVYNSLGYLKKALELNKQALYLRLQLHGNSHDDVAYSHNNLGSTYFKKGMYNLALKHYSEALRYWLSKYKDPQLSVGHLYYNMGYMYGLKGSFHKALNYFIKALEVYKTHPNTDSWQASVFNSLGILYTYAGSYHQALEYYEKAFNLWNTSNEINKEQLALSLNNIGTTYYEQGNSKLALKYLFEALSIMDEFRLQNPNTSTFYGNVGLTYIQMNQNTKALEYLDKASKIQLDLVGDTHTHLAFIYTSTGIAHTKKSDLQQGLKYHSKALRMRHEIFGATHPDIARSYNFIAEIYEEQNSLEKSLDYYQKGLIANSNDFEDSIVSSNPDLDNILNPHYLLVSLHGKSRILERISAYEDNSEKLKLALKTIMLGDTLIDQTRHAEMKHSDKLDLGKEITAVYETAIRIAQELYMKSQEDYYKNLSFYFAEKSKAGVLSEAVSGLSAKNLGSIPDSILLFEKELKIDRSFYQTQIQSLKANKDGYDTAQLATWQDKMFDANRSIDSLVTSMETNFKKYYDLKYHDQTIDVSFVQNKLNNQQALIQYFVGDSSIFIYTITRESYAIKSVPYDSSTYKELRLFRDVIEESVQFDQVSYDTFIGYASNIYKNFLEAAVAPLEERINELVIVPDGHLSYIPFDILLTERPKGNTVNYKQLPYLIKKYTVSYAHSASLLYREVYHEEIDNQELIAFAPKYDGIDMDSTRSLALGAFRDQVTNLKWNQPEIDRINQHVEGVRFLGDQALEADFKANAGDYSIIHLAMHALVDDENPMNSKLVFSMDNDSINDGFLHAYELYDMQLPADMVVLSACETGIGKLSKGEGVMSIARAFSYAGCPSVVMSHWSVNDESTADLMDKFYFNLSLGQHKNEALRNAKLSFLDAAYPPQTHPLFWGSFVVMGDVSPIKNGGEAKWWYIIIAVIVLSTITIYYRRMR